MTELETKIAGIPCVIRYEITGQHMPSDGINPPEYPELEYEVCDRNGRQADWLESKMTAADELRISDECFTDAAYAGCDY